MHDSAIDVEENKQLLHDADSPRTRIRTLFNVLCDLACEQVSIIVRRMRSSRRSNTQAIISKPLHATAWLNGLRGFAALIVFIGHHEDWGHDKSVIDALAKPSGFQGQYYFANMPIIRLFYSGGFSVNIFFIVSGFALSYKSMKLAHQKDYSTLVKVLGSSIFRRWLRLYLPVGAIMFVWMTSWHVFGISSIRSPDGVQASWFKEVVVWWKEFESDGLRYSSHIWTIPVEFRGSMMVYATVLGTSRLKTAARLGTETTLLMWLLLRSKVNALFIAGLMFADLTLLAQSDRLPRLLKRLTPPSKWLWYFPFVLGLCMASFSQNGDKARPVQFEDTVTDPMYFLSWLLPPGHTQQYNFWFSFWGAILMMASIPFISWMMWCLESRVGQFLGRVSFMFYLIHGPILWSIGARMFKMAGLQRYNELDWWLDRCPLPAAGPFALEIRWIVPTLLDLAICLVLASICTRCVDDVSIRFSHWIYKSLEKDDDRGMEMQNRIGS